MDISPHCVVAKVPDAEFVGRGDSENYFQHTMGCKRVGSVDCRTGM